jgi:hypothetical protein
MSMTVTHDHKCKKCRHSYKCPQMYCYNSFFTGKCKKCE